MKCLNWHIWNHYVPKYFESVIMFILDDASLNDLLDTESEEYDPDDLCRYARKILEDLDLPEVEAFISELPEMDEDVW